MLSTFLAVLRRDLLLAWRGRADVLVTLAFFIIVVCLFPFGVGAEPNLLRAIAPGVLWVAALLACLLFGFLDALAIRLQGNPLPLIGQVPVQLMQALPYILTVILLAGFIGKAIPPKAGGIPYVKER